MTTDTRSSSIEVRAVSASDTRDMRARILRPSQTPDELVFPGDDDEHTLHVAAYLADGTQVGITSLYREPRPGQTGSANDEWRLRGVATEAVARRTGVASQLMARCLEHVRAHGGRIVWCNARTPAVPFYLAHGFQTAGEEFEIDGIGPHYVMVRTLTP